MKTIGKNPKISLNVTYRNYTRVFEDMQNFCTQMLEDRSWKLEERRGSQKPEGKKKPEERIKNQEVVKGSIQDPGFRN